MKNLRRFMINNYWGKGYFKIPLLNKWVSYYKGGPRNFFALLAIGVLRIAFDNFDRNLGDVVVLILALIWVIWVLYTGFNVMGFGYWIKNPIKYEELEKDLDKWVYGQAHFEISRDHFPMNYDQIQEWVSLSNKFRKRFTKT